MTKLYRIVSYVIGLNGPNFSKEDIKDQIESNRYPEFHRVRDVQVTDIGEWTDDHPANKTNCDMEQFFPELNVTTEEKFQVLKRHFQVARNELINERQKVGELEYEIEGLKEDIKSFKKLQEFLKTIKDLTG